MQRATRCFCDPVIFAVVIGALYFAVSVEFASAQGTFSPLTDANIVNLSFNHYFTPAGKAHDVDFEWTFAKKEFVLKRGTGAIPADLLERLLPAGKTADEIRGQWKLSAAKEGQHLVLTEIKAGGLAGNKEVTLAIYKTAPTVVRIGQPQYVFGIGK